jgi:hypothetical protein
MDKISNKPLCVKGILATFKELSDNQTKFVFKQIFKTGEECRKINAFAGDKNDENFDRHESELQKMTA